MTLQSVDGRRTGMLTRSCNTIILDAAERLAEINPHLIAWNGTSASWLAACGLRKTGPNPSCVTGWCSIFKHMAQLDSIIPDP